MNSTLKNQATLMTDATLKKWNDRTSCWNPKRKQNQERL